MRSKEILEEIKARCPIKLGDLVWAGDHFDDAGRNAPPVMCLVESLSPANNDAFDRAYEGAEDHLMFRLQPVGSKESNLGSSVDYVCNMRKV